MTELTLRERLEAVARTLEGIRDRYADQSGNAASGFLRGYSLGAVDAYSTAIEAIQWELELDDEVPA